MKRKRLKPSTTIKTEVNFSHIPKVIEKLAEQAELGDWVPVGKKKPKLGQEVLVFNQGYGVHGNYYFDYELAIFIKHPRDKRRKVFAKSLDVRVGHSSWIYDCVTHWMPLPNPAPKITLKEDRKRRPL